MKITVKRKSYEVSWNKGSKRYTAIYPIASRYENGKLQAFSFMTELKGK